MRRPGRRKGRRSGWSLLLGGRRDRDRARDRRRLVWSGVALAGVLGVLVLVTLTTLPLRSDDLTQRLRREIDRRLPPQFGLTIARAELGLSGRGITVQINDVALSDPTASIASVESLSVTLDPLALIAQRIEPSRIVFERPTIVLPRTGEGRFDIRGKTLAEHLGRLTRLAGGIDAGLGGAEIVARDAIIQTAGGRRFEGVQLRAERHALTGRVTLEVEDAVRRLAASIDRARAETRFRLDLASSAETIRFGHRVPRSITLDDAILRLDVTLADGRLTGEGLLRLGGTGPDDRTFAMSLPCAIEGPQCTVRDARVDYGPSGATLAGQIGYDANLAGPPRFNLIARDVRLAETDAAPPIEDASLRLAGALLPERLGLDIERGVLERGDERAELTGTIVPSRRSPALDLAIASSTVSDDFAKQVWPRFIAPNTRSWVLDHIAEAQLGPVAARVAVAADAMDEASEDGIPLPEGAIQAEIPFTAASFDYVDGLPRIDDASGTIALGARAATISLDRGVGRLGAATPGRVESARFHIADVRAKPAVAALDARFTMASDLAYALGGPLDGVASALPDGLTGSADAVLALRLPLQDDIPAEAVSYDLTADLSDVFLPDVYEGRALEEGKIALRANAAGFDIAGTARLGALPVRVALFGNPDAGVEALSATIEAPVAGFRELGIDLTGFVEGPVSVSLAGEDPAQGPNRLTVDFADASVTLPARGVIKPAGTAANLVSAIRREGGTTSLTDMVVDGTSFRARGRVDVDARGDIAADVRAFTIGRTDSGSARLRTRGDSTSVTVEATSLDARPVLDWLFSSEEGASSKASSGSTSIEIRAGRVIGYEERALRDLTLQLDLDGTVPTLLAGKAVLADGSSVEATMRQGNARRIASIRAGDAGEVLRFVDIYGRVQGGELGIDANLSLDGATFGSVSIWNFEIADEVGLEVLTRDAEEDRRNTMAFDRLRIPFSHAEGRVEIGEGFIRGPAAGATFTGSLDLRADTLSIRGTFVPLYILNNVFSRVPIVGSILGSRRREGLFGITFAMDGAIAGPTLRVNPLSAIAPGMFRQIFEFGPASE